MRENMILIVFAFFRVMWYRVMLVVGSDVEWLMCGGAGVMLSDVFESVVSSVVMGGV